MTDRCCAASICEASGSPHRGEPIIAIDDVSVAYSIRELYTDGTAIRRLTLGRLRVVGRKDDDGRWNLGSLVRRNPPRADQPRRPGRRITFRVNRAHRRVGGADRSADVRSCPRAGPVRRVERDLFIRDAVAGVAPRFHERIVCRPGARSARDAPCGRRRYRTGGVDLHQLRVETPRSAFTLDGSVHRDPPPTVLELSVDADRFAFQEWAGVLTGLKNIAVESSFSTRLSGPLDRLATDLNLQSNGGNIRGTFVLNSNVPGWHGAGTVQVATLDLARWLNRTDRPSNITGSVKFDLDLDLGRHFPRGSYDFKGSHAAYHGI